MLQSAESRGKLVCIREWERDLQHTFTETQLDHLYRLTNASSVNTKMQANCFKLLTRWYRVPANLARIFPTVSDACWRGCGLEGTYLHIWWECQKLWPYWQDIRAQIKVILDIEMPDSPLEFLLHVPTIPLSHYCKSVLPYLLNAARPLIPVHWKTAHGPGQADWIHLINNIMAAEEWMATCRDRYEKFYGIWATWKHYTANISQSPQPSVSRPHTPL